MVFGSQHSRTMTVITGSFNQTIGKGIISIKTVIFCTLLGSTCTNKSKFNVRFKNRGQRKF
jgi:hypothetical protein